MAAVRVYLDYSKRHSYAELYRAMVGEAKEWRAFKVFVATVMAANGTTYLVCIDRWDRPMDAKPWAPGRISPFESKSFEEAEAESIKWAVFLGADSFPMAMRTATTVERQIEQRRSSKAQASHGACSRAGRERLPRLDGIRSGHDAGCVRQR